jgi:hypothetical protein
MTYTSREVSSSYELVRLSYSANTNIATMAHANDARLGPKNFLFHTTHGIMHIMNRDDLGDII